MVKEDREARSLRVNISLKPSTLELLQRWSKATGTPAPTLISDYLEESERAFRVLIGMAEKVKAAKEASAKKYEAELLRRGSKG